MLTGSKYIVLPGIALLYSLVTVIYRLFFHPLARYPGPRLAAATKWYEFYFDIVKRPGGQFMHEIDRMHKIYGPIVRINPEELHIKDTEWLSVLYTGPASGLRNKYPPAAHMTGTPQGIFGTIDHDTHRKRRAAISQFFSKIHISAVEPMIHDNVDFLCVRLKEQLANSGVAEMRKNFLAVTTDTLCGHAFDKSLNLLESDQAAINWQKTIKAVAVLTPLVKQFTWIIPIALMLPLGPLRKILPDLSRIVALHRDMHQQAEQAIHDSSKIDPVDPDSKTTMGTAPQSSSIFRAILSSSLPADEKKRDRIAQEGFVVIAAGGETTARVLATATFHLLADQESALTRLKDELVMAMEDPNTIPDMRTLEKLPWLTAVIKESLRITGLVTSRLPLTSPNEHLRYKEWEIPPCTPVSMTLRDVLLDPNVFDDPLKFCPGRWFPDNPNIERLNQAYVPFGRGSRMCIGLNLALAELYIIIACLFRRFDLQLHDTTWGRDVDAVRDCFIAETSPTSLGIRVKGAPMGAVS